MMNISTLTWADKFALIDEYKPTDETICRTFKITLAEWITAKQLWQLGVFQSNPKINIKQYEGIFNVQPIIPLTTTETDLPETATKRSVAHPHKRGRKSNKIITAFLAVPEDPIDIIEFAAQYNVSVAVLKQSKRFLTNVDDDTKQQIGTINIRKNKETKQLMIWKTLSNT